MKWVWSVLDEFLVGFLGDQYISTAMQVTLMNGANISRERMTPYWLSLILSIEPNGYWRTLKYHYGSVDFKQIYVL